MGRSRVGTEHLLLGLVRGDDGAVAKVLKGTAVTRDNVRSEVRRMLSQDPSSLLV